MSLLSIVLPAYNEEQNIANTAKVLGELLEQHGIDYELVFISDGSKDGTFERIKEESARNPRVRGAEFSRNFGKEAGIFAGLELTTGDAVIVMDCDLQHPPETIIEMYRCIICGSVDMRSLRVSKQIVVRKALYIKYLLKCFMA